MPVPTLTFNAPVGTVDPRLDGILDEVLEDAYDRHDVAAHQVTVVRAEPATWADASLGCPEPGVAYAQALATGYWIVLDANAIELDYRVAPDGSIRLCTIPARDREAPIG